MSVGRSDLPDFSNPPVSETLLSVQFEPLIDVHVAHFGLFWKEIKDRFPRTDERVELPQALEQFPEIVRREPSIKFHVQAFEAPPIPRCWFMNDAGTELIQIQKDRFIKNWRKIRHKDEYPRYENVKAGFQRDFGLFRDFAVREGLGEIHLNQCEVTYVNHIVAGEGWISFSQIDKVFTIWEQPKAEFPGEAQDVVVNARFTISDETGNSVGRLHVSVQPLTRLEDGALMFVMNLTARGYYGSGFEFFDLGREWIVRSFKNLTTSEMHKIWGLKN